MIRSKTVSRRAKLMVYKTVITPIVTYVCETWAVIKNIIRRIFGGINVQRNMEKKEKSGTVSSVITL